MVSKPDNQIINQNEAIDLRIESFQDIDIPNDLNIPDKKLEIFNKITNLCLNQILKDKRFQICKDDESE